MKKLDITDKLKQGESPVIVINNDELYVNDDAMNMLQLMELLGDDPSNRDMVDAAKLLFKEESYDKLVELKLNFKDFLTVIEEALNLITDEDAAPGE